MSKIPDIFYYWWYGYLELDMNNQYLTTLSFSQPISIDWKSIIYIDKI